MISIKMTTNLSTSLSIKFKHFRVITIGVFLLSTKIIALADAMACPPPKILKQLLQNEMEGHRRSEMPILLPCCYDGLTARLVTRAGFEATFMTGFGVSAVSGFPDTQLVSYAEMQAAANSVAEALYNSAVELNQQPIPCIADGDTGVSAALVH